MTNKPIPAYDSILSLTPYVGGTSKINGFDKVIKLSSNEGAFGTNPTAVQACKDFAENMFRYPDGGATALRQAIGQVYQVDNDRIVCGNGSDELIGLLCQSYLQADDEVIITQYGFLMYKLYTLTCGAVPVTVPEKDLTVDVDAILNAVTKKTKIVFIANPANPTGTWLSKQEIKKLCDNLPSNVLLVLDAAYAEFVENEDFDAGISFVDEYANVVMLRTFSKVYGLGGIRLGWGYASKEITDVLNSVRGPFNVNGVALAVGQAAVLDQDFVRKSVDHNKKWLDILPVKLSELGLKTTPSVTNFILVHFAENGNKTAEKANEFLLSKGIIVRAVKAYGLPNSLRITIGNDDEMTAVIDALSTFMMN